MTMLSIGDLARNLMLQRNTAVVRQDLDRLTETLSSGLHSDMARAVGGDAVLISSLDVSLMRNQAWQTNASTLRLRLEAQQSSLQAIDGIAAGLSSDLLVAVGAQTPTGISAVGKDAGAAFASVIAMLNIRVGETYVFSGQDSDRGALIDAGAILDHLETLTTTAISVQNFEARVVNWFADPAGFSAFAYQGGPEKPPVPIGPEESLSAGPTARDPRLHDTLAGLAMAALIGKGAFAAQTDARAFLAQRAAEKVLTGAESRIAMSAQVGISEQRLALGQVRLQAEKTAMDIARVGIVSADPFETALRLRETEARLESIFTITARLSKLSLVGYLR